MKTNHKNIMTMRTAFDARYINDRYHGIGRYAFRLLEALVTLAPAVTFIVFRGKARNSRFSWSNLERMPNVELRSGPWPLYWPSEQLIWPALLKSCRANMFYSPYFVAPILSSVPAAVTVHDLIFDRYPQYMPMAWSRPYYRFLMKASLRKAKIVFSVSEATAKDLMRYYDPQPDKVRTVSEGVDSGFAVSENNQDVNRVINRYQLKPPYVLAVGTRRPHKNFARLVDAFGGLTGQFPHQLVFAGQADDRFPDEARLTVERKQLQKRVRFLDWVPDDDLPGLYAGADLMVMPSLIEGFGLPVLEAMACRTPVLVSEVSSLPEVVGEEGYCFNPSDVQSIQAAMQQVLSSPATQRRMAMAGCQRAAGFTWERSAQQTWQQLESIHNKEHR